MPSGDVMAALGLGPVIGCLLQRDLSRKSVAIDSIDLSERHLFIHLGQEHVVGRDADCHFSFEDTAISCKHLKIYSIAYDPDNLTNMKPLIYAEDLSRNGSYWNGSYIGKGNGGVLLTDGDELQISPRVTLIFRSKFEESTEERDWTQEDEMRHFSQQYKVTKRKLGSGAHGSVFMAINLLSGRQSACKIIDLRKIQDREKQKFEQFKRSRDKSNDSKDTKKVLRKMAKEVTEREVLKEAQKVLREAEILMELSHPNIVKLEKVFRTIDTLYIFQELLTGGDLFSYIHHRGGKLDEAESAVMTRQVVEAIKHIHDKQMVHRDIKPENILIASQAEGARVVLTDFGVATRTDTQKKRIRRMETVAGTMDFVAPEVNGINSAVKEKGYTRAVDMWSLGCVTTAMLTGGAPFSGHDGLNSPGMIARSTAKCDLSELLSAPEWQCLADRPKDFVLRLLILDETQRMTADEALSHDWFGNTRLKGDFDAVYEKAIRGWRKQIRLPDVIETIPGFFKSDKPKVRFQKRKNFKPIEPHYKPHHRVTNQIYAAPRTPLPTIKEALEHPQYALRLAPDSGNAGRGRWNDSSGARDGAEGTTRLDDSSSSARDKMGERCDQTRADTPVWGASPTEKSVYFPVQKRKRRLYFGKSSSDADDSQEKVSPAAKKTRLGMGHQLKLVAAENFVDHLASLSESFP